MNLIRTLAPILAFATAACSGPIEEKPPTILAAASMRDALTEAVERWTAQGNERPALSFAASSALARQVESGAPADIFISADEDWMDRIEADRLLREGTRRVVAGNRLVLIAGNGCRDDLDLSDPAEITAKLGDGRFSIAEPESVPAGRYAKAALEKLELWETVKGRLAPGENVRAGLALVERGQAPLGVVYASDAAASQLVCVAAAIPPSSHLSIRYPGAVLKTSRWSEAEDFLAFLASSEGQRIFVKHGFASAE